MGGSGQAYQVCPFIGISHPYSANELAKIFMEQIYRLHGLPEDIISNRDLVFISKLWQELFAMLGVWLNTSTAYYPQRDGQTEVVNRCVETYLRCLYSDSQKDWMHYLGAVEQWYNTTFHSSIQYTLYEALYGRSTSSLALVLCCWRFNHGLGGQKPTR